LKYWWVKKWPYFGVFVFTIDTYMCQMDQKRNKMNFFYSKNHKNRPFWFKILANRALWFKILVLFLYQAIPLWHCNCNWNLTKKRKINNILSKSCFKSLNCWKLLEGPKIKFKRKSDRPKDIHLFLHDKFIKMKYHIKLNLYSELY
jgi:hypothetical protein